jgi:predicted flap endonuclease-1-like 5' DNA nuclease
VINGIGKVYERKLNRAGVYTYAELAVLSARKITDIIQPKEWQKIEPEKWAREAERLARKAAAKKR